MNGIGKGAAIIFWCSTLFFMVQGMAVGQESINIGFTGPLTGPSAYIGIDAMHGAMIAAKEINDEGGVMVAGKKVKGDYPDLR